MDRCTWCILATAILVLVARPVAGQHPSVPDSELAQGVGHWVASGVVFQSGRASHRFAIDVKRLGNELQASLPPELVLPGGTTYLLDRASAGVFRHIDAAGRVVEFSVRSPRTAVLVITGSWGDSRVTWQLTRG